MDSVSSSPQNPPPAAHLVFVPAPLTGHIISTLELANLLLHRHPRLTITIFLINLPQDPAAAAHANAFSSSTSLAQRRICFIHLPPIRPVSAITSSFAAFFSELLARNMPSIRDGVAQIVSRSESPCMPRLAGFVVDMFTVSVVDIADVFGAPTYVFYTSGAAVLGLVLHLQALRDERNQPLADFIHPDTQMALPGFANPVPLGKVVPASLMEEEESLHLINLVRRFRHTKGILLNTFEELETHALKSLSNGGTGIPPIYPVGPILNLAAQARSSKEEEALLWLDRQPPSSVVFLCFGSMGWFDAEQVREIACGLERSGHRFLWSVRRPPAAGGVHPEDWSNPEEVVAEGFLKRTAEVGRVIGWAPQVAVLSHPAVGGFVSHCGWNSVLESLWLGVPVATWPMYAEQQANAFLVARELGVATEMRVEYRKDPKQAAGNVVVSGEEVERGVMRVMDQNGEVRRMVKAIQEDSRKAVKEGGSSYTWLGRFIDDVIPVTLS